MKHIFTLITLLILTSSCKKETLEDKAKSTIETELKNTLHDFKSYELVAFKTIDSSFTSPMEDPIFSDNFIRYTNLKEDVKSKTELIEKYKKTAPTLFKKEINDIAIETLKDVDTLEKLLAYQIEYEKNFLKEFNGWTIQQSFRANNASGNKIISHRTWHLNKNADSIIGQKDLSK